MARIELGNGVQTSARANSRTNASGLYSGVQAGVANVQRAQENMLSGIRKVGETLMGISHDMAETTNAVRFSDYQMQSFQIDTNYVTDKLENDFATGSIKDKADFDEKFNKYTKEAESQKQKLKDTEKYAPSVLDKAAVLDLNSQRNNYAQMAGRFPAYQAKKNFETTDTNMAEQAKSKAPPEQVVKNMESLVGNLSGYYKKDTCDKLLNKHMYDYFINSAKNLAYSEDKSQSKAEALKWEKEIADTINGVGSEETKAMFSYLNAEELRNIDTAYKGVRATIEKEEQAQAKKEALEKEAQVKGEQARDKEVLARGKVVAEGKVAFSSQEAYNNKKAQFFAKVDDMKYLTTSQKIEIKADFEQKEQTVANNNSKAYGAYMQEQNKAYKEEVYTIIRDGSTNEQGDLVQGSIAKGTSSYLSKATQKNGEKINRADKEYAIGAELMQAVINYDPKGDSTGGKAFALYNSINAIYTDDPNNKELINNPEYKARLIRELRQSTGVLGKQEIAGKSITEVSNQAIEGLMRTTEAEIKGFWSNKSIALKEGKKTNDLSFEQNVFMNDLSRALEERLKMSGIDTEKELNEFLQSDPYMDRLKCKVELYANNKDKVLTNKKYKLDKLDISYDRDIAGISNLNSLAEMYNGRLEKAYEEDLNKKDTK